VIGAALVDLQLESADGALPIGAGLEHVLDVVIVDREFARTAILVLRRSLACRPNKRASAAQKPLSGHHRVSD
jgi:hypothetical protein